MTATWDSLPDPTDDRAPNGRTCEVTLDQALEKIVRKHIAPGEEPWCDMLGAIEKLQENLLLRWREGNLRTDRGEGAQFAAVLKKEFVRSLEQPRVVLCESNFIDKPRRWQQKWEAVLPCGALLIVRESGDKNYVSSCYFLKEVVAPPKDDRWVRLCEVLREQHCELRPENRVVPLPYGIEKEVPHDSRESANERRRNPRFVTLEQWGLTGGQPNTPPPWIGTTPQPVIAPSLRPRKLM